MRPTYYLILSLIVICQYVHAQGEPIGAQLSGFEEIPAIFTTGAGQLAGTITRDTIAYTLTYSNLKGTPTSAQLRFGQWGASGGIVAFLCGGGGQPDCPRDGTLTGSLTAADIQGPQEQGIAPGGLAAVAAALHAGALYLQITSDQLPDGEIRGQAGLINTSGSSSDSGIKGSALVGPNCGDPDNCAGKPYQATIVVMDADGLTEIIRFATDSDGDFHISLAPGDYQLTDTRIAGGPPVFPYLKPLQVNVQPRKFTAITVLFNSGALCACRSPNIVKVR